MIKICVQGGFLATLLTGLCASAQTNTTAPGAVGLAVPAAISTSQTISTDPAAATAVNPAAASRAPQPPRHIRMALLLPLNSPTLSSVAEIVRDGFFAAYDRDNLNVTVTTVKTGAQAHDVVPIYLDAAAQFDIVIGPLSREDVAAVAQSGKITTPTIALSQPDWTGAGEEIFPQKMLMMGLSTEDEARQVAGWAGADRKSGLAFILSTNTSWQRRAATAFEAEWQNRGLRAKRIELATFDGYLGASSLAQLKAQVQADKPAVVFLALDAPQALPVRLVLGQDTPLYGTSQLNTATFFDLQNGASMPDMDGVRLVDLPWQLQPDHLAVMSYPRAPLKDNQRISADLERLFALGIDAYRVAKDIGAQQQTEFTIDGVTGALTIRFGRGSPSFKREEQPAVYRQGYLVPSYPTQ